MLKSTVTQTVIHVHVLWKRYMLYNYFTNVIFLFMILLYFIVCMLIVWKKEKMSINSQGSGLIIKNGNQPSLKKKKTQAYTFINNGDLLSYRNHWTDTHCHIHTDTHIETDTLSIYHLRWSKKKNKNLKYYESRTWAVKLSVLPSKSGIVLQMSDFFKHFVRWSLAWSNDFPKCWEFSSLFFFIQNRR